MTTRGSNGTNPQHGCQRTENKSLYPLSAHSTTLPVPGPIRRSLYGQTSVEKERHSSRAAALGGSAGTDRRSAHLPAAPPGAGHGERLPAGLHDAAGRRERNGAAAHPSEAEKMPGFSPPIARHAPSSAPLAAGTPALPLVPAQRCSTARLSAVPLQGKTRSDRAKRGGSHRSSARTELPAPSIGAALCFSPGKARTRSVRS